MSSRSESYWGRWWRRRSTRRRFLQQASIAGAGLGAYAIAGCGGGDDDDDRGSSNGSGGSGGNAATSTATAVATQVGEPKYGGLISVAFHGATSEQPNLDVHQSATQLLQALGSGVAYSKLVKYRMGPDVPAGSTFPIPDTAESWEVPDEVTYIFKIRPEAKWQNIAPVNGRQVTAEDVAFSFQRQLDLKVNAASLGSIESMTAIDPLTLQIKTREPDVDFIQALGGSWNKIIAREVVEAYGDLKEAPVIGSNAWIHTEWVNGSVVKFKRNPDYWMKDAAGRQLPYADELQILRIPDNSTAIAAFEQGQIMYLRAGMAPPEFERIYEANKDKARIVGPDETQAPGSNIFARFDAAPTSDPRVREAISLAIDREQLLAGVTYNTGYIGLPCTLPGPDWALPEQEIRDLLPYDPAKAKQLLEQAGVSNWSPVMKFLFLGPQRTASELIHAMFNDIGIKASLESCDNVCNQTALSQSDFELLLTAGLRGTTTNSDLKLWFYTGGERNAAKISDPELDRLIERQQGEFDEEARRELLLEIQRKILALHGQIPLTSGALTGQLVRNELQNWYYDANFEYDVFNTAWINA